MWPAFNPYLPSRPSRPAPSASREASLRTHIRKLEERATELRIQVAAATAQYAITRSPVDIIRRQQASLALAQCLSQIRRLSPQS